MPLSPERAKVKTHLGITEVIITRFSLVAPALLAMTTVVFLLYFSGVHGDFVWSNLPSFLFCPCE